MFRKPCLAEVTGPAWVDAKEVPELPARMRAWISSSVARTTFPASGIESKWAITTPPGPFQGTSMGTIFRAARRNR